MDEILVWRGHVITPSFDMEIDCMRWRPQLIATIDKCGRKTRRVKRHISIDSCGRKTVTPKMWATPVRYRGCC